MTERAEEANDKAATHNCEASWEIWAHSRTWNPARQTSLSLSLCLPQIMLHNHKGMPHISETDLKQAEKEKNSKQ